MGSVDQICGRCGKEKNDRAEGSCLCGQPIKYRPSMVKKVTKYIQSCNDKAEEFHRTRGEKSDTYERILNVHLPTIEGLATYLGVSRRSFYFWEKRYEAFGDAMEKLRQEQAKRLIEGGLSGQYNPTITKVMLTNHGYREGLDQTSDNKPLPTPIYGGQSIAKQDGDEEE